MAASQPFGKGAPDIFTDLQASNVLDVGCAAGRDDLPAQFTPFGVEISRALHAESDAKIRARGGVVIHGPSATAIEQFDDGFFSGVILSSILEHEKNPVALLRGVHRVLAPGGAAYVRIPNFGSLKEVTLPLDGKDFPMRKTMQHEVD